MSTDTLIGIVSATIAFLAFLGSMYFAHRASQSNLSAQQQADRANDIAVGALETMLREAISKCRSEIQAIAEKMAEIQAGRKKKDLDARNAGRLEVLQINSASAFENLLNAYEDACGKFLDNKLDKVRFKKVYHSEIAKICDPETESYARRMHPKATSSYEAIWRVYDEWHRHE